MQPVRYECPYRKQSGVYGCKYQLLQPSDMSARIRISLDVLAENHLPALPISPAGAANLFIQSLTTCRQGLTQNGQSQGLSRQYPSDRTSFASILPRVLPVHPGCSACLHPVSARRSLCQAEALDGDDDNANPRSRYSTNI